MSPPPVTSRRVLDPMDRVSEILFGLIMTLGFTGSLGVMNAGREDVRTMLAGALGCNLAWGLIDGVFYLLGSLAERAHGRRTLIALRQTPDNQAAHAIITAALPGAVAGVLRPAELDSLAQRLRTLPVSAVKVGFRGDDWRGATGVFLLVVLSTFPVVLPFLFMHDARLALRISNLIAIVMLFAVGNLYGRIIGRTPWLTGVAMVILGGLLVGIAMALGG